MDDPPPVAIAAAADPIAELITTWNELNGGVIEELQAEPSPFEFLRYVARNTPFVVRRGAADWPATRRWDAAYLRRALGRHGVNVAVTPFGNADAPTSIGGKKTGDDDDGDELVFAKPHEEDQPFEDFLTFLQRQELDPAFREGDGEVRYAQTQNDNLRHEYVSLFSEVERSVAFARIALGAEPEAINMWVGNSRSTTALHKDNYENVYVQVAGRKHFVLLSPLCQPCVNERDLAPATYVRVGDGELQLQMDEDAKGDGVVGETNGSGARDGLEDGDRASVASEDEKSNSDKVPFAIWDPELPDRRRTPYSHLARPIKVTLDPGDMLYLPAMW
ncbi:hypothetical protein SLS62_009847 [Diatrype stigma]|uniref:JmjC domain-containing protein n=1 Tax=Diatrype stigma TaxID=117547 RepID=A0AAN9YHL7_9PEZI